MRKGLGTIVLFVFVVALLHLPRPVSADGPQGRPFGIGIILGEPSGLTFKGWIADAHAFQFHFAWDFSDDAFGIYGDYLFNFYPFNVNASFELPVYVGVGGKLIFRNDVNLGIRIPVGIAMEFENVPVEVFLEIVPGIRLIDETHADIDGGIGVRYYF